MKFSEFISESDSQLKGYQVFLTTKEEFGNPGHFFDEATFKCVRGKLTIKKIFKCSDFDKQTQLKLYKAYENLKSLKDPLLTL